MGIKFIPAVVALVLNEDRELLLIQRRDHPFKKLWGLPGGRIEPGEHIDDASKREVREETGIIAKFIKLWGILSEMIIEQGKLSRHHLVHICLLHSANKETHLPDKKCVKWISNIETFRAKKLIPSDMIIIRKALQYATGGYYKCTININRGRAEIVAFEEFETERRGKSRFKRP